MLTEAAVVRKAPLGLVHAVVNLVMEVYRADDKMVEDVQILVDRYFPDPELQKLTMEMLMAWHRAYDLMERLSNDDLMKVLTQPTTKHIRDPYLARLENDLFAIVGENDYWAFMDRPEAELCQFANERGFLMWAEIKISMYVKFSDLLIRIMRHVEEAIGDVSPAILGEFVAGMAVKYIANIYESRTQRKFVEERTALMFLAAYAIHPQSDSALIGKLFDAAVRVTGLRFATSFNPYLGPLERQARQIWFSLQSDENVKIPLTWIETAIESGGYKRKTTFQPQPLYLPPGKETYDGAFPTPFLLVHEDYWKRSVNKEDLFPPDILQGTIPLIPLDDPRDLFLTAREKMVPITAVYGPMGAGKTSLLDSLACWRIDRNYVVFRPTMPRDQGLVACLPVMPFMKRDWNYLTKQLKLTPRGYPCKFLNIYEKESDINKNTVYTAHDVKIHVDSLDNFQLPWKKLLMGMPAGYLLGRQLDDPQRTDLMRASEIRSFFEYRQNDRSRKIVFSTDEVWQIYSAMINTREEALVIREMQEHLNDVRGLNLAFDFATVRPASLQPEILEYVTTFLFGELRESGVERARSSRGRMFEAIRSRLPDSEKVFLPLVEKIMENVSLGQNHLFFMLGQEGRLRLIRAMLPPHSIETPGMEAKRQFELYKEMTGTDLLRSPNELEEIDASHEESGRRVRKPY